MPTLLDGDTVLSQSLAILEYLEEKWPDPPLLPQTQAARARVRQLALIVACDVHPLQNLWVLKQLGEQAGFDESARQAWARMVIERGLGALAAWPSASRIDAALHELPAFKRAAPEAQPDAEQTGCRGGLCGRID